MRKPTFVLKPQAYKTDKLYAQVPHDGSCDLSIGSYVGNGTRVNKYGLIEAVPTDTPRIDYLDGVGLLLEPARKNLVTTSTGVSGWSFSATLTANAGVAPDGEYTAARIQDASGTALQQAQNTWTVDDATAIHTISLFVKLTASEGAMIFPTSSPTGCGGSGCGRVKLYQDGTVEILDNPTSAILYVGSSNYGNGWYRVWIVFDMVNTDTALGFGIYPVWEDATVVEKTGSVMIWGYQVEEGSFPTSYIPTSGSALTREDDFAAITSPGLVTNGVLSVGSGAIFMDVDIPYYTTSDNSVPSIVIGQSNNGWVALVANVTYPELQITDNSGVDTSYQLSFGRNKILYNIFGEGIDAWVNGTKQMNVTTDIYLGASGLNLGGTTTGMVVKVRAMAMWDAPLNDTESKAITQS